METLNVDDSDIDEWIFESIPDDFDLEGLDLSFLFQCLGTWEFQDDQFSRADDHHIDKTYDAISKSTRGPGEAQESALGGYQPKGSFHKVRDNINIEWYIAGPRDATSAIYIFWDTYGFAEAPVQLADLLAEDFLVLMPDSVTADQSTPGLRWMFSAPGDRAEARARGFLERQNRLYAGAAQAFPNVEKWGIIVNYWGDKVCASTGKVATKWKKAGSKVVARPLRRLKTRVSAPLMLAEDADAFYHQHTQRKTSAEHHALDLEWKSCRADLTDPEVLEQYKADYRDALVFFRERLLGITSPSAEKRPGEASTTETYWKPFPEKVEGPTFAELAAKVRVARSLTITRFLGVRGIQTQV